MNYKILTVEDEEDILLPLKDNFELEGYSVTTATDGEKGLALARNGQFDLIVLDVMLPKVDGFELCKRLREAGCTTPILMLTVKGNELDRILGLEIGADDYVTKPFSPRELLARTKAILRRTGQKTPSDQVLRFGDVEIDFRRYEAWKNKRIVSLTALEFSLLKCLVRHQGEVLSRDSLLREVWGTDVYVFPRTVDLHVAHLRKKLETNPARPKHILGIRGVGYKFVA